MTINFFLVDILVLNGQIALQNHPARRRPAESITTAPTTSSADKFQRNGSTPFTGQDSKMMQLR
jgi:hypothetical protein